jgi:alpha-beta hydrolase superfamily lysophospholipase
MLTRTYIRSPFDGLQISILSDIPEEKPKAIVQIAHGICGRKERFTEFMQFLSSKGYACVVHDHRGHGESIREEGDRGYSYQGRSNALIADMMEVTSWIRGEYPDTPIYLLGHSMGSMVVRTYIKRQDNDISGIILCGSPSYDPLSPIGYILARLISLIDHGRLRPSYLQENRSTKYNRRFKDEGDKAWTCSVPSVRKAVREDPACNFIMTADYSLTLMELVRETYSRRGWNSTNNSLPILFLSGSDDPCLINKKAFLHAVDCMRKAGYANVSYRLFPEMRHEVLYEKDRELVWNEILEFIS